MTFAQFELALYKASEDGKIRMIKTLKNITNLGLRSSTDIINTYYFCTSDDKLIIDFKGMMKYLHTREDWTDIKYYIRISNYYMVLINNLLKP